MPQTTPIRENRNQPRAVMGVSAARRSAVLMLLRYAVGDTLVRYAAGVTPSTLRNQRVRCAWSAKPTSGATSAQAALQQGDPVHPVLGQPGVRRDPHRRTEGAQELVAERPRSVAREASDGGAWSSSARRSRTARPMRAAPGTVSHAGRAVEWRRARAASSQGRRTRPPGVGAGAQVGVGGAQGGGQFGVVEDGVPEVRGCPEFPR